MQQPAADGHQVAGDAPAGRAGVADQRLPRRRRRPDPYRYRRQAEGVADRQGGPHRPLGVVLARAGDAEHRHGEAADDVLDLPAEVLDLGADALQVLGEHVADVLGVAFPGRLGRLVDVAQQHRDQLALGLVGRGVRLAGRWLRLERAGGLPRLGGRGRQQQVERGVLGEDRLLEAAQGDARLHPQLAHQALVGVAVGRQRLGLAAAAVQGEHELAAQVLAQRLRADQPLQLARDLAVPSEGELGLDALLGRDRAGLLQLAGDGRGAGADHADHVGQRGAAPQRERRAEQLHGGRGAAGRQPLGPAPGQAAEAATSSRSSSISIR